MEIRGGASDSAHNSVRKVEPINWAEKLNLNERRVPAEPLIKGETAQTESHKFGINTNETVTFSEEAFPTVELVDEKSKAHNGKATAGDSKTVEGPPGKAPAAEHPAAEAKSGQGESIDGKTETAPGSKASSSEAVKSTPESTAIKAQPRGISEWSDAELSNRKFQLSLAETATQADCVELVKLQEELVARRGGGMSMPERTALIERAAQAPRVEVAPPTVSTVEAPSTTFSSNLGRGLNGGFAFLGVFGGGMQVGHGIDMLRDGQMLDGSVTTMSGLSNTTAGTAALLWSSPAGSTFAMRAGGVGAVLDGSLNLYNGYNNGDSAQMVDGGVRTGLGGTMLYGGTAGMYAASAYAGWSVGRFLGGLHVAENKTVDDCVTDVLYNAFFAS
jgi:hypothetical protein